MRVEIFRTHPHVSSGRKFKLYSKREILRYTLRVIFRPLSTLRSRKKLDFFYDGFRQPLAQVPPQ